MRIGRWSEPRFVFVCQLVEVIREADANETSGEDGLALTGSLVGESQLRIPKLDPDIIFSNRVHLVSVELAYHTVWCALKSPSTRVSVVIQQMIHGREVTSCAGAYWGGDVGNDQLGVSQLSRDGQLLQMRFKCGVVPTLTEIGDPFV